ncbi:hypothetical protein HanRHA438_Chr08g0343551 [Helianthus annuus]|nr:hypothetical protein HanIR_Chr08g0358881 [Helianthus annuus]KAJ0897248.1 hypothetical protein HanRHA438_Chr08g0343551 [Helianthus annuus]
MSHFSFESHLDTSSSCGNFSSTWVKVKVHESIGVNPCGCYSKSKLIGVVSFHLDLLNVFGMVQSLVFLVFDHIFFKRINTYKCANLFTFERNSF